MIAFDNLWVSTIRSGKGDCIHLRYIGITGKPCNIIVDCGPTSTSGQFRKLCADIIQSGEQIDALLITHYDDDHIGGVLKVNDIPIIRLYYNAYDGSELTTNLSAVQNQRLFHTSQASEIYPSVHKGDIIDIDGASLIILAPTEDQLHKAMMELKNAEEQLASISDWSHDFHVLMNQAYPQADTSVANRASIVFIFQYRKYRMLFCGDAPADMIRAGLQDQDNSYTMVKLPHHGSARNISDEMLSLLDTENFMICADGSSHPNKQTIAKLLKHYKHVTIYSNYAWWMHGFILPDDVHYIQEGKLIFKRT